MDVRLAESINTFGIPSKADFVPPSEQLVTLTYGQLQDLITGAIEKGIQPLKEEVALLREEIAQDRQDIAALRAQVRSLESLQVSETTRVCLDIAQDRQRISALEHPAEKKPGKTETSRAEKIAKYLQGRPDHRATFETLKGHLQVDNVRLNEAVKVLVTSEPGRYSIVRVAGDKRRRVLVLIPQR